MKKLKLNNLFLLLILLIISSSYAYSQVKSTLAVVSINSIKMPYESQQLTDVTRNEMEKLGIFYVIDKYDQSAISDEQNLNLDNCSSKKCLVNAGLSLEADHVLTGSVEHFGNKIIIKYRVVNVMTMDIEKFKIVEFLDLKEQIQSMIEITLKMMYEQEFNQDLYYKLSKSNAFENTINTPEVEALDLAGPRMGLSILSGDIAKIFAAEHSEGGYNALPILTQFGYQFEIKYLNEGNFQALFEIVPIISGLDQGLFIPSLTLLNGLRSNQSGWEIGFGPQLIMTRKAEGYFSDGKFILANDSNVPDGQSLSERLDSRGDISLGTSFVFAFGKTFKSGSLNMPVNLFYKPAKNAHQFGISFGFNTGGLKKRRK